MHEDYQRVAEKHTQPRRENFQERARRFKRANKELPCDKCFKLVGRHTLRELCDCLVFLTKQTATVAIIETYFGPIDERGFRACRACSFALQGFESLSRHVETCEGLQRLASRDIEAIKGEL